MSYPLPARPAAPPADPLALWAALMVAHPVAAWWRAVLEAGGR